jgi:hypothetical protein
MSIEGTSSNPKDSQINITFKNCIFKNTRCLWFNSGQVGVRDTVYNLHFDNVICENSQVFVYGDDHGTGSAIHSSNRINISGRIETKRAGYPCISLGTLTSNDTITLRDLVMINDGTVAALEANTAHNVGIQNVFTNTLIQDADITEKGQTIIRDAFYK